MSDNEYTVYILRTNKNTLYTGITNNLEKRLKTHKSKSAKSAKYLKSFSSFELVYTESLPTKSDALKREYKVKQLTKIQKESLIQSKNKK